MVTSNATQYPPLLHCTVVSVMVTVLNAMTADDYYLNKHSLDNHHVKIALAEANVTNYLHFFQMTKALIIT